MDSQIKVIIAAELKKQGFDKASKATSGLENSFKKLGAALLATFGTQQIIAFGKASLKAFEEDEKAAMRLSQTVESLGLGFANPSIKEFISSLESSANVSDDALRPALEKLLRTTQSLTASQELLNLAIDISRGSGVDLITVSSDLARAYVGQTRSLSKYNIGLTQAELKTKSFAELQEILNKQFSGQNAAYLDTYAGKVEALTIAFDNAQEIIGESLADAFLRLAGDTGIQSATDAMQDFATQLSDVITGISVMLEQLDRVTTWGGWSLLKTSNIPVVGSWLEFFGQLGKDEKARQIIANPGQTMSPRNVEAATAATDKAAAKRQKELITLQKKAASDAAKRAKEAAKREADAAKLKKANALFDMERIQIAAALQGQISEEERLRLKLMQAIIEENVDETERLTEKLAKVQAETTTLANSLMSLKAGNPFSEWQGYFDAIMKINPFEKWPSFLQDIALQISGLINQVLDLQAQITASLTAAQNASAKANAAVEWAKANRIIAYTEAANAAANAAANSTASAASATTEAAAAVAAATTPSEVAAANAFAEAAAAAAAAAVVETEAAIASAFAAATLAANDAAMAEYEAALALIDAGLASEVNVTVNVEGSVVTETDLVTSLTDAIYVTQKGGTPIVYRSLAI